MNLKSREKRDTKYKLVALEVHNVVRQGEGKEREEKLSYYQWTMKKHQATP